MTHDCTIVGKAVFHSLVHYFICVMFSLPGKRSADVAPYCRTPLRLIGVSVDFELDRNRREHLCRCCRLALISIEKGRECISTRTELFGRDRIFGKPAMGISLNTHLDQQLQSWRTSPAEAFDNTVPTQEALAGWSARPTLNP